jgi:hypothetical protein
MTYWRMQIHLDDSRTTFRDTIMSLAGGYIGIDSPGDAGDLGAVLRDALPASQREAWAFAQEMAIGDRALVFARHFPFALVRIAGRYNHVRTPIPEHGILFRHFRRIDDARYYADLAQNPREWESIAMTERVAPLRDQNSLSYQLIERWLRVGQEGPLSRPTAS